MMDPGMATRVRHYYRRQSATDSFSVHDEVRRRCVLCAGRRPLCV
jgi:hypothetical protein